MDPGCRPVATRHHCPVLLGWGEQAPFKFQLDGGGQAALRAGHLTSFSESESTVTRALHDNSIKTARIKDAASSICPLAPVYSFLPMVRLASAYGQVGLDGLIKI